MANGWGDFISDFLSLTAGTNSPSTFRLWAAVALVGGALERRVWANTGARKIYPNLYTMLVAPPGVGKFIIEDVRDIWATVMKPNSKEFAFRVAPDNMTKAAMIDALARATQTVLLPSGPPYVYHTLLVAAEEMEAFMPEYDREFIGVLNSIYNNKEIPYTELRRHGPIKEIKIERAQLNLLMGVQPSYMATRFPEEMWSTGFSRRVMMVYAGEAPFQELFDNPQAPTGLLGNLSRRLGFISTLFGPALWTDDSRDNIKLWHKQGGPPVPAHSKLSSYNRSRTVLHVKLAIIAAVARSGKLVIELEDVLRSRTWMISAEETMPDIFREMVGRSDAQVIDEMHYFVTAMWAKNKHKPVNGELIMEFLLQRVPSEKASKIILAASQANFIQRVAGTDNFWLPRPKIEQKGIE